MTVKTTLMIDEEVLQQARECVREYRFKSLSSFVEKAVRDELAGIRQRKVRDAIRAAAEDPLFLADVAEAQRDFEHADFEQEDA